MTIKYVCPKCNKLFVDWGAEHLDFKCPDCEGQNLVRAGGSASRVEQQPGLRRAPKKSPKPKRSKKPKEPTPSSETDASAIESADEDVAAVAVDDSDFEDTDADGGSVDDDFSDDVDTDAGVEDTEDLDFE